MERGAVEDRGFQAGRLLLALDELRLLDRDQDLTTHGQSVGKVASVPRVLGARQEGRDRLADGAVAREPPETAAPSAQSLPAPARRSALGGADAGEGLVPGARAPRVRAHTHLQPRPAAPGA